jgi:hypothetical protein
MRSTIVVFIVAICAATSSFSQTSVLEGLARQALPNCGGEVQYKEEQLAQPLPAGISGKAVTLESDSPGCGGSLVAALTPRGNFYLGSPWFVGNRNGTPAERIRAFALDRIHESFTPKVGTERNPDGLLPVELLQTTEYGKVRMTGWVDPAGTVFFPGIFFPPKSDFARHRLQQISGVLAHSPSLGPADAPVTLVEFSDFQCPSCKAASSYLNPLLEKHASKVRYIRVDYPLVSSHPWAFGAAVIGRAIASQKPDAFWKYKDAVYANQGNLNLFMLEDFARGFVSDHDLDLEAFNKAIASEEVRRQILDSIAAAYALQVYGTPSFLVNGQPVLAGPDGRNLEAALQKEISRR